jgi:hypothetical protein
VPWFCFSCVSPTSSPTIQWSHIMAIYYHN